MGIYRTKFHVESNPCLGGPSSYENRCLFFKKFVYSDSSMNNAQLFFRIVKLLAQQLEYLDLLHALAVGHKVTSFILLYLLS